MTAGQIMEAEISASTLGLEDDDNTVQPQEPATSSSKISYQDHLGSETLPEDLFTSDVNQPPSPAAAATVQVSNIFFLYQFHRPWLTTWNQANSRIEFLHQFLLNKFVCDNRPILVKQLLLKTIALTYNFHISEVKRVQGKLVAFRIEYCRTWW